MSSLTLMMMWQAQPFRTFRIMLTDGRSFTIDQPHQLAVGPDLRQFVFMHASGPQMFAPELVAGCELCSECPAHADANDSPQALPYMKNSYEDYADAAPTVISGPAPPPMFDAEALERLRRAGVSPSQIAGYNPDPGTLRLMRFTATDGACCTLFKLHTRDGKEMLSTAHTRWDLVGYQFGENVCTLRLVHADDPLERRRIIAWPPDFATFDTFAEQEPVEAIQNALLDIDRERREAPRVLVPPQEYVASLRPPPPPPPPKPIAAYFRGDLTITAESLAQAEQPDRFTLETEDVEIAPHRFEREIRFCNQAGRIVFDLFGCGWIGSAAWHDDRWRCGISRATGEEMECSFTIDPETYQARVDDGRALPLAFVEYQLRSYHFHDRPEALRAALDHGPRERNEPVVTVRVRDGMAHALRLDQPVREADAEAHPRSTAHVATDDADAVSTPSCTLELWRGAAAIRAPFLQPRLLAPDGRVLFDLRGTHWGAMIEWEFPLFPADFSAPPDPPASPDHAASSPRVMEMAGDSTLKHLPQAPGSPAFVMRLVNREAKERLHGMRCVLLVHLAERRAVPLVGEGFITFAQLHARASEERCAGPLMEALEEDFTWSVGLP